MNSKKSTSKINFYLSIISELKRTTNLSKIQEKLNLSKQNLNYYLRELKKKGFVYQKGHGWWELTEKGKNSTHYDVFLPKDFTRGHAFVWNVYFPQEIKGWEKRIEILNKKNIHYKNVGILKNIPRIKVLGRKVWLCSNHLRVFDTEKSSYYGENAIESMKNSSFQLFRIISALESKFGVSLKPYTFQIRKSHYALIKNDLAIEHNQKGIILRIKDENGEEFLIIDDSLEKGGELETIGKKSLSNNIHMQKWWINQKDTKFSVTPSFILDALDKNNRNTFEMQKVNFGLQKMIVELTKEIKRIKQRLD